MKKTLAMLLAAAAATSISAAAMAQGASSQTEAPVQAAQVNSAPQAEAAPQGDPSGLTFDADKNNDNAILSETILEPGVEYKFPVNMVFGGQTVPMTEDLMKNMRLSYNKLSNTAVKTFKIEKSRDRYFLFVELKDSVPSDVTDVKYNIKLARRDDNKQVLFNQEVK